VIGRDHLDTGSAASSFRETECMPDGSDAIADWPLLNALVNTAAGANWVSIHNGGEVGIGYSQHAGTGACANLSHPYIEVEDTALAILRFRNGALAGVFAAVTPGCGQFPFRPLDLCIGGRCYRAQRRWPGPPRCRRCLSPRIASACSVRRGWTDGAGLRGRAVMIQARTVATVLSLPGPSRSPARESQ
jgi:hypothetical protein